MCLICVLNFEVMKLFHDLSRVMLTKNSFQWNRKTRLLHAKGLSQVLKWLEELKEHHGGSQKEAGLWLMPPVLVLFCFCF